MLKGIIFDLDETLIDSTSLKNFRTNRDWRSCYVNLNSTCLYEGIETLLGYINQKGLKIAIVTMAPRPYAEKILNYHNIAFDSLIAYHDVKNRKPNPEPMLKSINSLKLNPSDVLSFGDDVKDIEASLNAEISAYGVSWGVHSKNDLYDAGAEIVFDEVSELLNFLEYQTVDEHTPVFPEKN